MYTKYHTPPEYLAERIMSHIASLEKRATRIRLACFSISALASFTAMITSLQYAWSGLTNSGTSEYLSLLSSDGGTLLLYWKEFTLTLAESLPLLWITALLTATFVLIYSISFTFQYAKTIFLITPQYA